MNEVRISGSPYQATATTVNLSSSVKLPGVVVFTAGTGAVHLQTYASPAECRELAASLLVAAAMADLETRLLKAAA